MSDYQMDGRSRVVEPSKPRILEILGPGLVTGASDDDPSGIATYSQAGAQFGYLASWTLLFTYPLMVAVQMISARIGRTTGRGLAGSMTKCYPRWLVATITVPLLIANVINLGADLGAMGDAAKLLLNGNSLIYVAAFGMICILLQILLKYKRYVAVLKWLSLALLSYVATVFVVHVDWPNLIRGLLLPTFKADPNYWSMIVAIFGTTISPYLFFWQASQEAEDLKEKPREEALVKQPQEAEKANTRITLDTVIGMAASNIVALAIITTTAATLNTAGITNIESSVDAAKAIEPLAGHFAQIIFATGIIGTGLLAVPVLAGSAAYAVGEAARWKVGLSREPSEAKAFYLTVALATVVGMLLNFTPIPPMKALFWSAVINGVAAVPVMIILILIASNREVMKQFVIGRALKTVGWASCFAMVAAVIGMALTALS
ncbi:NRAMP (natural resistance-associated macrophage protein)-like metal ion transporter [Rhizobium sp. BK650]|uniref:NRAMP family divalent metal transporter n=1 Tax=Rhizobium sp. BK650 TaxID=2586990 RepID=UPI001619C8F1|nr:divalent metal cation transporter [Rhizobium sp. BK650]MBB3659913.1 NRAMP (natural resistance-associated macrophage protein)-like metal ion transporter [Rhizobium sp. BK650]